MFRIYSLSICMMLTASFSLAAEADKELLDKTVSAGISFLQTSQGDDGSWTASNAPGITGLAVYALLENGVPVDDSTVAKGLKHLESFIQEDGGIYFKETTHRNYETCIAMMVFLKANQNDRYTKVIKNAESFLRGLQWDEGEGLESSDIAFGGAGYGSHKRPDLSNTQFLIEALKAAGAKDDDPAIQNALKFVSRTQNLETENNTTPFASKVGDGGFYYTPAAGGTSQAGTTDNGGLRSYASMTYAGLKSMIYAGLTQDDPRVKAAWAWIQKYYNLDENPGLGQQGLFYYYQTFAKTLKVMKIDTIEDSLGREHDWRAELVAKLAKIQKSNGSWLNESDRWYEGDPNLVTAYALLALADCK
ncbi:MAG TPA: prenyltransferase/squalene oxidase repeat-containing protein [Planctomycetaceae bacterium]|nr:prenyltransferase/squalene oxidase repeat-containing protein [Planctomycetaceae bacterium]